MSSNAGQPSINDWLRLQDKQKRLAFRLAFRTAPLIASAFIFSLGLTLYTRVKGAEQLEWLAALSLTGALLLAARAIAIWRSISQQMKLSSRAIQELKRRTESSSPEP